MNSSSEGSYKWLVLLITSVGSFMTPLDSSIVSVSLPTIASSLKMDYETVIWIPTSYLLVLTVLLLSIGRLADLRGRRVIFILGFAVFTAGSFLSGISGNGLQLVAFRVIQGVGAAFVGATATAIVTDVFPGRERGKALGINTMAIYVGLAAGPSLGGFLTHALGWRSIFYVNVPIGIFVIVISLIKMKESTWQNRNKRFDLLGASTFSLGLLSLLVALTMGSLFSWESPFIITLFISALVFLSLFAFVEFRRGSDAMLDISLFTQSRLFSAGNITALLNYTAQFGVSLFASFYLQRVLNESPLQAGIVLLVMPLVMIFLSPLSGWLSDRVGSRALASSGMALVCVGLIVMSRIGVASSPIDVAIGLFIIGSGMGLFSSPNASAVMGSVEKNQLGVASGTLGTMRFLGQSMSLAIMGAIVATFVSSEVLSSLFTGFAVTNLAVATETFVEGMSRAFIVSAFICAVGVVTSLVRGKRK